MAAVSSRLPVWCIFGVLASFLAHVATSSAEGRNDSLPCVDGVYEHDGRTCCLCAAGQYLKAHCTTSKQYGDCKHCAQDTYRSQPNSLESCEPCTSCSQPNANREVKQSCTSASDTKCQCKKDHYCSGGTETCIICNPCKECPEGIKVACTSDNNTVCNEKVEGVHNIGIIIGIVVFVVVLLALLAFFCIRKRRRARQQIQKPPEVDVEMQSLSAPLVDLEPHLTDIAEMIGWKDMRAIALRSGISNAMIDSCQLDHPNNSQEQTFQLLQIWVERHGKEASRNLIQILQRMDKKGKAGKVLNIVSPP